MMQLLALLVLLVSILVVQVADKGESYSEDTISIAPNKWWKWRRYSTPK